MILRLLISIAILFSSGLAYSAVWETQNEWNQDWEYQYQKWVVNHWNKDIFTNPNSKYEGIPTDCADAAYAMRVIFSFENKLPFAIQDPTRYTKVPVSNKMKRWDKKSSELARVRSFINYLSSIVSTRSMPSDTVPVALNRDNLTPGIIYVKPKKHSYQIKQWTNNGIPIRTHSTTPFKVRELLQYKEFPTFVPEDFVDFSDGYRRFKRPNELYKPVSSLEGYSIEQFTVSEQFDKNKSKFNKYLKNKTLLEKEAIAAQTNRMMNNLCQSIYDRAKAINDGHNYFLKIKEEGRNCMNASEFDQYSTFSRDSRLTDSFLEFKNFIDSNDNLSGFNFRNKRLALDIFAKSFSDRKVEKEYFVNFCHIDYENDHFGYKSNHKIQLRNLWQRIQDGLLVQNPNTTADRRWGHYYGEFKTDCPTFEEIH